MKKLSSFFSELKRLYVASAPMGAAVPYIIGLMFILFYFIDSPQPDRTYLVCGEVVIFSALFIQIYDCVCARIYGAPSDFLSNHDKLIIGTAFRYGSKKRLFYSAMEMMLEDNNCEDALDIFRDLKNKGLTDNEQGVLGFYTAVCYNRMGYSTNAAQCAATAAEKGVCVKESLLMAARSFSMSASYAQAEEYYEKLISITEKTGIYPFIYNEAGRMFLSANKPEKSRYYFEKSVAKGYDPISAQGGLALTSLLEGKEDEACERYRLALIADIDDTNGFKEYSAQICTANGYPENFFEEHLRKRYGRSEQKVGE